MKPIPISVPFSFHIIHLFVDYFIFNKDEKDKKGSLKNIYKNVEDIIVRVWKSH